MEDIRLDNTYEDKATGFKGVCVGVWISHAGTQLSLAYMDGNVPRSVWIDTQRLVLKTKTERPGFST